MCYRITWIGFAVTFVDGPFMVIEALEVGGNCDLDH